MHIASCRSFARTVAVRGGPVNPKPLVSIHPGSASEAKTVNFTRPPSDEPGHMKSGIDTDKPYVRAGYRMHSIHVAASSMFAESCG